MKKILSAIIILSISTVLFAGGIVTNTNQSSDFIRMMNRNASTELDAAYFNPAGLTKLEDGLHLYLSSQTIWQTRTVTTHNPNFNVNSYEGTTFAPVFPNFYLAYKTGKLAYSFGFQPIGGGGSAEFDASLPSFERELSKFVGLPAAALDPSLAPLGDITGYSMDAYFTGSSLYLGFQVGASYEVNDMISVAGGLRFISAKNTYEGALEQPKLITAAMAFNPLPIDVINVESERTGTAMSFIGSVNLTLNEMMNISLRYETQAALVLTSSTEVDDTDYLDQDPTNNNGMFPDTKDYNADMPAQFAFGLGLNLMDNMNVQTSFNYYFNTSVNWDGMEEKVDNGWEGGLGVDYGLSDALSVSVGYLIGSGGAMDAYQSDISYSLNSQTLGTGLKYTLSDAMAISFGISNTFYEQGSNGAAIESFLEEYDKTTFDMALGLEYHF